MASGDHEVDFETLLVAEVVQLSWPAGADLMLQDLRRHEPLEQGPEEGGPAQLLLRLQPEQMTA